MSFQKVANKQDLKEGGLMRVEMEGKPVVLALVRGKIYAMDAVCSHEGGPLDEGKLEGHDLTCPWHYAVFDVRNGKVSDKTVWATSLHSYPVQVAGNGDIMIDIQGHNAEETVQQERSQDAEASERKYYEEQERKTADKLNLELLSTEKLQGTDIMTFRLARDGLDYIAGQFAFFKLDGVTGDAKGPVRHFSIASSPTETDLMISTKIRDSLYKQKLALLKAGTKILAWGPQGEFVLHNDYSKPAVFLSGGIGVTPFRSMIKYATDKRLPLRIVMLDSNSNESGILYKSEFDKWAQENKNLKIVYTVTDENAGTWTGEKGRINKEMITKHLSGEEITNAIFYICGPPGMLKAMHGLLQEVGVPDDHVKKEEFTGY